MFLQFIKDAQKIKQLEGEIQIYKQNRESDTIHFEEMERTIKRQDEYVGKLQKEHEEKMSNLCETQRRQLEKREEDYNSQMKIANNELQMKINEAVEKEKAARMEAEMNLGAAKQEISILRSAFENLGFDVKDMKEILNKLVDGVISKNEVRILSTKE